MSPTTMRTLRLPARRYEDYDDCLTAAARDAAIEHECQGWDLHPRWEDEMSRDVILVDVPLPAGQQLYRITSSAGLDHGDWQGESPAHALAAMHRDAGYDVTVSDAGDLEFAHPDDAELRGGRDAWSVEEVR